jgi:hypothetical protein
MMYSRAAETVFMVERQNEQCRGVVVFCLALGLIEAALQYWNEFKVSVGFVSVSRTPERIKNHKIRLTGSTSRIAVNQRWREFFVTMFPVQQGRHEGRPVETAEGGCRE